MIRRPPRSTRTYTLFPTRRSSDLGIDLSEVGVQVIHVFQDMPHGDDIGPGIFQLEEAFRITDGLAGEFFRQFPGIGIGFDTVYFPAGFLHMMNEVDRATANVQDRKSTRLNSSH